jgi:hypothetical protein
MAGVFYILLVGVAVSIVVLLIEMEIHKEESIIKKWLPHSILHILINKDCKVEMKDLDI